MPRIVLTVIGDDRAGLVHALSDVVSRHSGNWERSQMAELAGKFAGIVVVSVPAERTDELTAAPRPPTKASPQSVPRGHGQPTSGAASGRSWWSNTTWAAR